MRYCFKFILFANTYIIMYYSVPIPTATTVKNVSTYINKIINTTHKH